MALHTYVVSKYLSGTCDADVQLDINQLSSDVGYEVDNYKDIIAEDIYGVLENYINPNYDEVIIRQLLDKDGKYSLSVFDMEGSTPIESVVFCVNNATLTYYYDVIGDFIFRQIYKVYSVDDANLGYLVTEHIIGPSEGCSLIEHCYVPYFSDLSAAKDYRDSKMRNYSVSKGSPSSGYRISVVDINDIVHSDWYNDNLELADAISRYNLDPEDYRYISDVKLALDTVKADAYDCLSEEESAQLNYDIYRNIREYIDPEYVCYLDDELDMVAADEVERITDTAIIMALLHAKSEDEFLAIREKLGPNIFRVGALTDDIYNANPNKGYIVISEDGDMGWYEECYSINEWEGAKGNPYFGKFQRNTDDALLCLREYHPEYIAPRLPSRNDIEYYETLYQEEQSISRKEHKEMYFDLNDEGQLVVYGHWYYNGILSKKCSENISFLKTYGSHEFTKDECKALLSGEEIEVKNFVTKMDIVTTIKGRLRDCAGMYDDDPNVQFVRTDIDINRRRRMNAELGIDEPGLPDFSGDI
ncbi:hypothetical protein J6A31_04760 [bacterium]|nr:hypothetical protein [bacterium]